MSNDVLITPASRKIEFKDSSANVDAKIETDASGNLVITNTGGDISIGDTTSDIFVGDGTNNIDIVFEQDGEIRGTTGVTVTLGQSDSNVRMATDLNLNSNDITNVNDLTVAGNLTVSGTTTTVNSTNTTIADSIIELNSGLTGSNTKDIGFIFERGSTGNNAGFVWDESADRFTVFTTTDTASSDTVNTSSVANFQAGSFYGNGANLTSLNASNLGSGTVPSARLSLSASDIPSLAASKITSGTFADARIPSLAASKITSGTFDAARIPTLNQNTSGTAGGLSGTPNITVGTISSGAITAANIDGGSTVEANAMFINTPDTGSAPAITALLRIYGYEGRGAGIKIRDSVNSASGASNREWFIGSGYSQSGFNIGYAADGSQSSYSAQNKFSINTSGHATFAGNITVTGEALFNGTKLEGDSKEMLRFSDSWLRINPDNDFTSGIYAGTGIFRTDGQFQVGSSGSEFKIESNGNTTVGGNITPAADSTHNLGSSSVRWSNVYADTLYGDGSNITGITATDSTKLPLAGGTMTGSINLNGSNLTNINYLQFQNEELTTFSGGYQMVVDANDSDSDIPSHGDYAGSVPFGIYFTGDNGASTTTLGSGLVKVWHTGHFKKAHIDYFVGLYDTGVTTTEFDYLDGVTSNIQTQLDGKQASGSYLTSSSNLNASNLTSGTINSARIATGGSGDWWSGNPVKVGTDGVSEVGKYIDFHNTDTTTADFDTRLYSSGSNQLTINGVGRILTTADEGPGNGLDADTLDGQHGSYYAQYNHFRSLGNPAFTGGSNPNITTAQYVSEMESDGAFDSFTSAFKTTWSYAGNYNLSDAGTFGPTETAGMAHLTWTDNSDDSTRGNITVLAIAPTTGGSAGGVYVYNDQGSTYSPGWREIWTSSTDGPGSGLDADLLDGEHGSYYATASGLTTATNTANAAMPKTGGTFTGDITISNTSPALNLVDTNSFSDANDRMVFRAGPNNLQWQWFDNSASTTSNLMQLSNTAHLTLGADDTTPMLDLLFDDHASGAGWDTRIQIGKSDDLSAGTGVFPTYVPAGAYGMQVQANSDGVFFGMEEYSTGNFRPIIQWGDDDTDTPFRIKHENGSEFTVSYNGIATATTRLSAPQVYATVASGTAPLVVTSTTLVSNLNADRLDGQHGSYYQNASNINAGTLADARLSSNVPLKGSASVNTPSNITSFTSNDAINTTSGSQSGLQIYQDTVNADAFMTFHIGNDFAAYFGLDGGTNDFAVGGWSMGANSYKVFHAGNSVQFTSALNTKLSGIATGADVTPSWVPSSNPNYLTSSSNLNASNLSSGTVPAARINSTSSEFKIGGIKIGAANNSYNYIAFHGTTGDQNGNYNHSYIGERIYSGSEKSELLLAKYNDVEGSSGSDRIRHIANNHVFDTYTVATTPSTDANIDSAAGTGGTITTRMIIDQNGKIGMGLTDPQQNLAVGTTTNYSPPGLGNSGGNFAILKKDSGNQGNYGMLFGVESSGNTWIQSQRVDGTATGYTLRLQPSGGATTCGGSLSSTSLTINGQSVINSSRQISNVGTISTGIHTISSSAASHYLNMTVSGVTRGRIGNTDTTTSNIYLSNSAGSTSGTGIKLTTYTNVNNLSPCYGNGTSTNNLTDLGTTSTRWKNIYAGSSIYAGADVVAYSSSDERLKDNLEKIQQPIEKIQKLSGYEFDWNDNQDIYEGHDIGVVAQEVEKVLPEIVETRENGYKAVKYEKMVALLIEGMKEQQEQIKDLQQEIKDLKENKNGNN